MRKRRKTYFALPQSALAPAVMWMRMPVLMGEALFHSPAGKPETVRAVSEKIAASAEGVAAAQMSLAASAWGAWFELASGKHPAAITEKAFRGAQRAAETPFNKRVRANYKRLSKS